PASPATATPTKHEKYRRRRTANRQRCLRQVSRRWARSRRETRAPSSRCPAPGRVSNGRGSSPPSGGGYLRYQVECSCRRRRRSGGASVAPATLAVNHFANRSYRMPLLRYRHTSLINSHTYDTNCRNEKSSREEPCSPPAVFLL